MKKMMNLSLVLMLFFGIVGASVAQDNDDRKAKREQKMTEKLIKKLELTEQEQADFLPLVREYGDKTRAIHESVRGQRPSKEKMGTLSDREVEDLILRRFDSQEQEMRLRREYHSKFKQVLPIKKVAKFYLMEQRMREKMRGKMRDKRAKRKALDSNDR